MPYDWISSMLDMLDRESAQRWTSTNLYHPANMALAKRAIQWGAENVSGFSDTLHLIAYAAWTKDDGVRTLLDELYDAIGSDLPEDE